MQKYIHNVFYIWNNNTIGKLFDISVNLTLKLCLE